MTDDFESLKKLGKTISKEPTSGMLQHWAHSSARLTQPKSVARNTNWWQLAVALLAGVIIGKFLLQTKPDFFSITAQNNSSVDETFEYIYTNN